MLHLLMMSGGVDSTGYLFKLLKEVDKETVCLHHINIIDKHNRHKRESFSIKKIVEYCRKEYGMIKFTTSTFHYNNDSGIVWDLPITGFYAGIVARDISIDIYNNTRIWPELNVYGCVTKDDGMSDELKDRMEHQQILFNSYFRDYKYPMIKPEYILPCLEMTKKELYEYIPEELRKYVWSCREPKEANGEFIRCGICNSCQIIDGGNYVI